MNHLLPFSNLSLRVKLVLSYLAVALGAIFFLAFAISIATTLYFEAQQKDHLRLLAEEYQTELFDPIYLGDGGLDPSGLNKSMGRGPDPAFAYAIRTDGTTLLCAGPGFINTISNCQSSPVQSALKQAIQQNTVISGNFD